MMNLLNSVTSTLFNWVYWPFTAYPAAGMVVISLLTSIVMLYIFRATSDQSGIRRAKNLVKGHFLAIRLYRDDISLMFDTMRNILSSNALYIRNSIRPMLFLLAPVALILVQLGARYEFRPLETGETTVLKASVDRTMDPEALFTAEIELPEGLVLDAPPVRIPQQGEVTWRLRAVSPGEHEVVVRIGDANFEKKVHVGGALPSLSPAIARNDFITALMNPSEASLPGEAPLRSLSLAYPKRAFAILGLSVHWLIAFFVLSLVFAFALKGRVGVEV